MNCSAWDSMANRICSSGATLKENRVDSANTTGRLRYYPPESDRGQEIRRELESLKAS